MILKLKKLYNLAFSMWNLQVLIPALGHRDPSTGLSLLLNHLSSGTFLGHCMGVCGLAGPVCKLLFVWKPSEFY